VNSTITLRRRPEWWRLRFGAGRALTYLMLSLVALLILLPFLWMITTALRAPGEEVIRFGPLLIPRHVHFENFTQAWETAPFGRYFFNSFFVAMVTTLAFLATSAMGGYAFARLRFPGQHILWLATLGTLMIPAEVLLIPNYITLAKWLHWSDTYYALIIPWTVSAFGIFLMRQVFLQQPKELWEAARLDGCGHLRFLWQILLPQVRPTFLTLGVLKFFWTWDMFLWVVLFTNADEMRTVTYGLYHFTSEVGTAYELWMAASLMSIAPIVLLFLSVRRQIIEGISRVGLR